jgi:hypothetical protein
MPGRFPFEDERRWSTHGDGRPAGEPIALPEAARHDALGRPRRLTYRGVDRLGGDDVLLFELQDVSFGHPRVLVRGEQLLRLRREWMLRLQSGRGVM